MPSSEGNETYVKDYLFKLLEYKNSSEELTGEDNSNNLVQRTNTINHDIKLDDSHQMSNSSIVF